MEYSPAVYIIDGKKYSTLEEYRFYVNTTLNIEIPIQESFPYYGGIKEPAKDYGSGKTSIVVFLIALLVDGLAMGGIYIQYKGTI